jgi:hypothetical protein
MLSYLSISYVLSVPTVAHLAVGILLTDFVTFASFSGNDDKRFAEFQIVEHLNHFLRLRRGQISVRQRYKLFYR